MNLYTVKTTSLKKFLVNAHSFTHFQCTIKMYFLSMISKIIIWKVLESTVFQTEIHRDIFQLERCTSECWNSSKWIEVWKSYFLTLWVSKFFTTTFCSLFNVCKVMNKNLHFLLKNNVVSLILSISHVG